MVIIFVPELSQLWHCLLAGLAIASVVNFYWKRPAGIIFHALAGTILLFVPSVFHEPTMIGELDKIHLFLQRFSGAFHLGYALFNFRNRHDLIRGETVVYYAKALGAAFLLLTNLFTAYQLYETKARGVRISPNFLSCVLLFEGVWSLVELYRLFRQSYTLADEIDLMCKRTQRWIEGRTYHDIKNLFWADAALSFYYAFFNFAFPGQLLKAVTQTIIFGLHVYGHFVLGIYNAVHVTPFIISGFYITLLLSTYYRIRNEEIHEIEYELENPNRKTVFTFKKSSKAA